MYNKINSIFKKIVNRNINKNEYNLINIQIQNKNFNLDKLVYNLLNSREFAIQSLQKIENIFKSINYDIKTIKESIIISFVKQLQNGTSLQQITKTILKNYKIKPVKRIIKKTNNISKKKETKNEKNISKINMLKKIFNKILKREPQSSEISKYINYSENDLENVLLHTTECSKLIDIELNNFIKQMNNKII